MVKPGYSVILIILFLSTLLGCSAGSDNVMQPGMSDMSASNNPDVHRVFWAGWEVWFDIDGLSAEIRPIRYPENHFNVTGMIHAPGCENCMDISVNCFDAETRILDVDIWLRNASQYAVRDVRGIVYTDDYGHELANDDGWTGLWDMPGGKTINPFRAFSKDTGGRIFMWDAEASENFLIHIPEPAVYSAITFAIDASWPGNCEEPFEITNYKQWAITDVQASSGLINIDVLDWQDDVAEVTLEAPEITGEASTPFSNVGGTTWAVLLTNNTGAPEGSYEALVKTTSEGDGGPTLYDFITITITPDGINLDLLFAPPTGDELQAIRDDWASRDVSAQNFQIEDQTLETDGRRMFLVSHTVDNEKHYGLVHLPAGDIQPGSLPVLMILHGGCSGTSNHELYINDYIGNNFIQVVPSFRGEPFEVIGGPMGGVYYSEGVPGDHDSDADDTIALLSCVLENFVEADASRIALIGTSRGGGCAMRMKVRDPRVDGVVVFYGATSYLSDGIKAACYAHLTDPVFVGNNPLQGLAITEILDPLLAGTMNIIEAKHKLLLSSPLYFFGDMPRIQVHHGIDDPIVPILQGDMLEYYMGNADIGSPDYEYFRYEWGIHEKSSLIGHEVRVEEFMQWIVGQG